MAYQSLYRRYRPQKFAEIRGQHHVVSALQNAVVKGEVGHAYLFHGPRGTGKTTSARVLAKALNCENLGGDGEPCGECESCVAIEHGRSFDLHELDAASNNKVEDMRDLLGKVNLGTPGRAKVYILDEVHMLTSQAENALLKTLEEPPDHVTWVLATTEPHKVVDTIRSRCQVFELSLLGADDMAEHVRWVIEDAALGVGEDAVDHVIAAGGGSVRDTLSALDRVVAAGGVVEIDTSTDALLEALAHRDVAAALTAIGDATGRGRDPRTIGEGVLAGLRDTFLTAMGAPPPRIAGRDKARAETLSQQMSPAIITRALETLGVALVEMRRAPDPRVDLEVALVRLCRPDSDHSLDAVLGRLELLEQQVGGETTSSAPPSRPVDAPAPPSRPVDAPVPAPPSRPVDAPVPAPPSRPVDAPVPAPSVSQAPSAAEDSSAESGATTRSQGPAAAARRALAEKRVNAAVPRAQAPAGASAPPPMPPPAPPRPPDATGSDSEPETLRALEPSTPSEVVQLAGRHLGLDPDVVIRRAADVLGPSAGGRSASDLARLWQILIDDHSARPDSNQPSERPVVREPVGDQGPEHHAGAAAGDESDPGPTPPDDEIVVAPDDPDDIDMNDLVDAPDHAEELIERLTEAFPGAELHTKEEPQQP